jgi:hypothetical protein
MTNHSFRHQRFAKDPALTAQEVVDELLLVPHESEGVLDSSFVMNEVAGRIWTLIDGQRQVHEISAIITDEFEVSQEMAEADLTRFLKQLEHIGVVWAV